MNIKSGFIALGAIAGSVLLTGCNLDKGESITFADVTLCNLVIPSDASSEVTAQSNVKYKIEYNLGEGKVSVSSDVMKVGGAEMSLTSNPMTFSEKVSTVGYARNFKGTGKMSNGDNVSNLTGAESTLFYYYPTVVPGVIGVSQINNRICLSYEIGDDYTVKTFGRDLYFMGETILHSSAPGQQGASFTWKEAVYRLYFAENMKTATVVVYNITFAENMPALEAMCLENLDVSYSPAGYTVSGKNVVPKVMMKGNVSSVDRYLFNDFRLQSTGEMLTKCICNYTVSGVYNVSFEGQYMEY
ncbi:MAG: hypothetical protein K2I91_04345 [Muribaculaceae bacterium]|nr:hypothetical protein [Muribaculaceae bacterium]